MTIGESFPLREFHAPPPLDEDQSRMADETTKTKGASSSKLEMSAGSGAPPLPPPADLPKSSTDEGIPIERVDLRTKTGCMPNVRPPGITAQAWWNDCGPTVRLNSINIYIES